MDEHHRRIDAAIKATTLDELRELLADLQVTDPLPQPMPAQQQRRRSRLFAVAGGVIVLAGVIGWTVFSGSDDPPPPSAAAPPTPAAPPAITRGPAVPVDDVPPAVLKVPRQLDTAEGMAAVLDEIRKRFGSTMGYELAFRPDRAFLSLPDPANDRQKLMYTYSGGWGNPSDSSRSDTDDLADLGALDVAATAAAWQSAPATLQIAPGDVQDTYLDIDHIGEPGGPGALETLIRVSTKQGRTGFLYLDAAGAITRIENPS